LCGFKLLILLVDSFPDVVNVITSNNTVLNQRKKIIFFSNKDSGGVPHNNFIEGFITVVIYKKAV
jgi:hypothetical protein